MNIQTISNTVELIPNLNVTTSLTEILIIAAIALTLALWLIIPIMFQGKISKLFKIKIGKRFMHFHIALFVSAIFAGGALYISAEENRLNEATIAHNSISESFLKNKYGIQIQEPVVSRPGGYTKISETIEATNSADEMILVSLRFSHDRTDVTAYASGIQLPLIDGTAK